MVPACDRFKLFANLQEFVHLRHGVGSRCSICQCEAGVAGDRPRGNVSVAELAELIHVKKI